jgi:DNA-binding MarR family transcriptional regulator
MTAATISVALKSLEGEGLVERRGDEDDMRATRVYLTEKGREVDRKNRERVRCVDGIMMKGLSETEQDALMTVLLKMRENLLEELKEKNEAD